MSIVNMEVFNKYFMPATIETLKQKVEQFNSASGNTIMLTGEGFEGDFMHTSFYNALHSAQRRVDRYAVNAEAPVTPLTQSKETRVKVAGGFGPVLFEPSQLTWLQKPTSEGVEVISRNLAEAIIADQLNTAIASAIAGIGNQPTATKDLLTASIDHSALNDTDALFGDHSTLLRARVMTGAMFHKLIGLNINNENRLFVAQNVQVVDILGRLIVVTDSPALFAGAKQRVLTLSEMGVVVNDGGDLISNIETTNGKGRIETTMQVDYTFGVGLKGYAWDEANGGASPSDADLQTGANWDLVVSNIKSSAGVLTIGA